MVLEEPRNVEESARMPLVAIRSNSKDMVVWNQVGSGVGMVIVNLEPAIHNARRFGRIL